MDQTDIFPNQEALNKALNHYRTNMRGFIIFHLKKIRGQHVEDIVIDAFFNMGLTDRANEIENSLNQNHRDIKSAIDIDDFPRIINDKWKEAFKEPLADDKTFRNQLWLIKDCRDQSWAHPPEGDADAEGTRAFLFLIADVLGKINKQNAQQNVEAIRDQLLSDDTSRHISEISKELEAAENDKKKLKKELAEKKQDLEKMEETQSQYEKQLEILRDIETEKKKSENQVSILKKEVKEYEEMWNLSEENLKTANQHIRESEKQKKSLEERVTELEQQSEETTKQKEDYKKQLKASEESLSNTSDKLKALQEEKRVYIELIQAIENELAKVKNNDNNENISKTQNHLRTGGKSLSEAFRQSRQNKKVSQSSQWSGDKTAREVVRDAVGEITQNKTDVEFTIKDVNSVIRKTYTNFKETTTSAQIIQDCPNHPSRKHHTSKHNYYWRVERGKYRLFDPEKDKIEDLDDSIN